MEQKRIARHGAFITCNPHGPAIGTDMTIVVLCIAPTEAQVQGSCLTVPGVRCGTAIDIMVGGFAGMPQVVNRLDAIT